MICARCPEGRTFANGSTFCRFYGIIIREDHQCRQERGKEHERNNNFRHKGYHGPRVRENGGWFAGSGEELLPGPGEREGIPEMEEREGGGSE